MTNAVKHLYWPIWSLWGTKRNRAFAPTIESLDSNGPSLSLARADWTHDDWKRVIRFDETKIKRISSDGFHYYWSQREQGLTNRRAAESTICDRLGGGNIMLWASLTPLGLASVIVAQIEAKIWMNTPIHICGHVGPIISAPACSHWPLWPTCSRCTSSHLPTV